MITLYAARVEGTNFVRLGLSKDLNTRLKVMQKHCHRPVDIVQAIELSCTDEAAQKSLEKMRALALHDGQYLRGDWFKLSNEALALMFLGFKHEC